MVLSAGKSPDLIDKVASPLAEQVYSRDLQAQLCNACKTALRGGQQQRKQIKLQI